MTAGTTIVGLIPLAWGDTGLFNMKYFPLARTVMGGLIASTLLTLIVLPTYYSLVDDCANWLKRMWFSTAAGQTIETQPVAHAEPEPAPASGD
jgi:HAE1 family hydrophobic/amphiphilic exporter-1